jgi:hypothetical protein
MDLAPPLPDDVLAGVLRRLAPRGLVVSRCVCQAWRRVVDDRRLLRADLLPRWLGGIFLNLHDLWFTQFLSRPTTGAAVSGRLDYTMLLNYELSIVPDVPYKLNDDNECEESEWPPATLILPVFSSKTGSWEGRAFGRDGEAAGMLPGMAFISQHQDFSSSINVATGEEHCIYAATTVLL